MNTKRDTAQSARSNASPKSASPTQQRACTRLHADVKKFTAGAPPSDDLTILALRFIQDSKA